MRSARLFAIVWFAFVALAYAGSTASAADFYAHKQIEIVVSTEAGTVYDAYARLLARHLPEHIPGDPSIIVDNMPGGGGLKAANYMFNEAPRDGTVIAGTHNAVFTMSLVFPSLAKFDERKFSWIGSVTKDPYLAIVRPDAPIRTVADAEKVGVTMGGPSAGSLGVDMVAISNALLGTKFKVIAGYKDPADVLLAMRRREVDGAFSISWSELKPTNLVQQGKVRIIAQEGVTPFPAFGPAPMLIAQARNEADREALVFMLGRAEAARPYFGPPGMPAERLAILRKAFDDSVRDPAFLADAARMRIAVDQPMDGDALAGFVNRLLSTPKPVTDRVAAILANSR
jgi:tripartite-type tricarboxylate transporter receptor subunit TctC